MNSGSRRTNRKTPQHKQGQKLQFTTEAHGLSRGYFTNYLFANISNIFNAPPEIVEVIKSFPLLDDTASRFRDFDGGDSLAEDLCLNEDGEVEVPDEMVIGLAADLFGDKVYETVSDDVDDLLGGFGEVAQDGTDVEVEKLKKKYVETVTAPVLDAARKAYDDLTASERKRIEGKVIADVERKAERVFEDLRVQKGKLEIERKKALDAAQSEQEEQAAHEEYSRQLRDVVGEIAAVLAEEGASIPQESAQAVVHEVETAKRRQEKGECEDEVRGHLRGFARTIPSFLMAYGDETTTLKTFDKQVPADVFYELTSITIEQFRFLRDGGDYTAADGSTRHFDGHLFDEVVFDDSIKEFLRLKEKLSDYFSGDGYETIFDYIPPQRTNQIFTPKATVELMLDLLEIEQPGCFDDPDKTFCDTYMKSGLYIAGVVRRLYRSEEMKDIFPNGRERIRHIIEKQVFGMAPTQILYDITTSFILDGVKRMCPDLDTSNFVCQDALELARVDHDDLADDGKENLAEFIERVWGDKLKDYDE